jgi:hypothetical protein
MGSAKEIIEKANCGPDEDDYYIRYHINKK